MTTEPELVIAPAGNLADSGLAMTAGNATAAASMIGMVPAAADRVSALTAAQFAAHAARYQAMSAVAAEAHNPCVITLGISAGTDAAAEATNVVAFS